MFRQPRTYQSWGRYPHAAPSRVTQVHWPDELRPVLAGLGPFLAYGKGRSYGDSCLNKDGHLLDVNGLDRITGFDSDTGMVECEAGVSLAELLEVFVPKGWFLPVTPGTKFVTVGGAIANDVHGKNHHCAGTLGCHVENILLIRSDGNQYRCSREENRELFCATVGGLGLTGVIVKAALRLKRIGSSEMAVDAVPFHHLDEFLRLTAESEAAGYEYTVAWLDCMARTARGVFYRGNHAPEASILTASPSEGGISVPIEFPNFALNRYAIRLFNAAYFRVKTLRVGTKRIGYQDFFYPLDSIQHWNRVYGKSGLLQYQCVVPEPESSAFARILREISEAGDGSFLGVIKKFGRVESPGIMSFPRPGLTLALDFPRKERTLGLFDRLDAIVLASGGAIYPAKDARMSAAMFRASFPRWAEFAHFVDPKFSSSFWRRVGGSVAHLHEPKLQLLGATA